MTARDVPRPQRADARANREALLCAARELFVERGLTVSFDDIAQRAAVGRATLYRHFADRDALLEALLERLVEELESIAAKLPDDATAFAKLFRAAVRQQADKLPLAELLPPGDALPEGIEALRHRIEAVYRAPLARAQEAGAVRADLSPGDVRVLASMLSAVIRPTAREADRRRALRLVRFVLAPDPS
jgi:AcrR family transcriptional regulator